jgi:NADH dehydrogenase [ubiquinone] 1 alpha subcomplex assembly factor 7
MKANKYCKVTDHAGEADITSHVDFEVLGHAFAKGSAKVARPMTQGQFLQAMGLEARTQVLAAKAAAPQQQNIISASERLANPAQMGELFKVMAVTGGLSETPYPF